MQRSNCLLFIWCNCLNTTEIMLKKGFKHYTTNHSTLLHTITTFENPENKKKTVENMEKRENETSIFLLRHVICTYHNENSHLPDEKILDHTKLKAICRRQVRGDPKSKICFEYDRKHCGKRRKWWLPEFSFFSHNVFKSFFL